ncbi:hypothetical protein H0H92_009044 [Tricholoma furcatifolium]|nr:hypothetical protein H0H92_009044 [Tricholoma furcatifolium]
MSSNAEVLVEVGQDFNLKIARVVSGAICYGIYLILMSFLIGIFHQRQAKYRHSNAFLMVVTVLMFLGGTLFLSLDTTDLVRRMQIIMINNPDETLQTKLDRANDQLKKTVWTGEMLFIFMLILGDSVVVWRTWTVYKGHRQWLVIPLGTWLGSLIAGLFELGCDIHTDWAITDLNPSAASVGAETCAHADLSSYTLSYVTNIFCTLLIAYKAWLHRKLMSKYLGEARRKTAVEKVLTLLLESGFVYIVIYTLQAVPIYGAQLTSAGLIAFNVVNAIIQQAMGMYPTVIIILVRMHKSLWDTTEVSQGIHSQMKFRNGTSAGGTSEGATTTVISSSYASHAPQERSFAMVDLNQPDPDSTSEHKKEVSAAV